MTTNAGADSGVSMGAFFIVIFVAILAIGIARLGGKKKDNVKTQVESQAKVSEFRYYPKILEIENDPDKSYLVEKLRRILPGIQEQLTDNQIAKETGIPRTTIYTYRKKYFRDYKFVENK